jgi:PAS domain S-box-containing protein
VPESPELLGAVFDGAAAAMALLAGPELRLTRVNQAFRALCDPAADPTGQRLEDVWPVPDLPGRLRATLEGGATLEQEDLPVSAASQTRWFSIHARRIRNDEAQALLLMAWETTTLVASRWIAEAAAEEAIGQAAQLQATFAAIADAVVVFDGNGVVTRMNAAANELVRRLGLTRERLTREDLARWELRSADGAVVPRERGPVRRALAGEVVRGLHARVPPPAGPAIWLLVSAAPVRDSSGVAGAVLVLSDETAMRELEEARDDLVRMVSHDLRTPLNVVYTQAHLLQRTAESPEKVRERALSIERSCERMSGMIQDLVEATLLEAGHLPLARAPVDLSAFLPELLDRLRGALPVERVRLEVVGGACRADLDAARIERIVVNLVSNALKYSSQEVVVRLAQGPLDTVVLSVSDRGVGISPEDQRQVFDRFFRALGSRRPEGLGLGLYIARLLAEAHGGRIEVESELGQGSTFRLVLPAAPAPAK